MNKKETQKVSTKDQDEIFREQERQKRKDQKRRTDSNNPEEVDDVLKVQNETLESLARSKGMNSETVKLGNLLNVNAKKK